MTTLSTTMINGIYTLLGKKDDVMQEGMIDMTKEQLIKLLNGNLWVSGQTDNSQTVMGASNTATYDIFI